MHLQLKILTAVAKQEDERTFQQFAEEHTSICAARYVHRDITTFLVYWTESIIHTNTSNHCKPSDFSHCSSQGEGVGYHSCSHQTPRLLKGIVSPPASPV